MLNEESLVWVLDDVSRHFAVRNPRWSHIIRAPTSLTSITTQWDRHAVFCLWA